MPEYIGKDEAQQAAAAYQTPRFLRLKEFERWVEGTQYDGRPDWWTGGEKEAPLFERRPCLTYPAVRNAISSNVDVVMGEGRFPTITTRPDEDDVDEEDESGSDETDEEGSDDLDKFIRKYHKIARFKAHAKEAFEAAQTCGTAVAIHGHRNGRPFADLVPARWCTPKLDIDGNVTELEIKYVFFDEVRLPDGKWKVEAKLFRRVINESNDVTYQPADADKNGTEPKWVADPEQTIAHNLGFCPVIWYPFMRGCGAVNEIDGRPIHKGLTDEVQALDMALSLKHRSAMYSEGQIVEIGVDPDHNPTAEEGRQANVESTEHGGLKPGDPAYMGGDPGKVTGRYLSDQVRRSARKKGPTFVWRYSDPDTKVEHISQDGHVLEGLENHANDCLSKLEESLAVVLPRPTQFKFAGAVSGRSLIEMKQRQYDRCDKYRDDLEDNFLIPSVGMQLRIAYAVQTNLKVPGIAKVLPILAKMQNAEPVDAA